MHIQNIKVALVHYWLVQMRGGEKVLEAIADLFPHADIFTNVCVREKLSPKLQARNIKTTFINRIPGSKKHYQKFLPLMPMALEQLDLQDYDLIISSESGPAKGIICRPDAVHICYCHTPMRYIWDMYYEYKKQAGFLTRMLMPFFAHYLRLWDVSTASRVHFFAANSSYVAGRIKSYYNRNSEVIHPPADLDFFKAGQARKDFYLWVGELVAYKRPDIAVQAFNELDLPLVVIGDGPEKTGLEAVAGKNIIFLGKTDCEKLRQSYASCRALIFPGVEDFGIVPVEAMACGAPVIAFERGGAKDTVLPGVSGLFMQGQTASDLVNAVREMEINHAEFDSRRIAKSVDRFRSQNFARNFKSFVDGCMTAGSDCQEKGRA